LAQAADGRGYRSRHATRARPEEADPSAPRRAAQERAGCSSVRAVGVHRKTRRPLTAQRARPPIRERSGIFRQRKFRSNRIKLALGAISLGGAKEPRPGIPFQRIADSDGEFAAGACHDRSRPVAGHEAYDAPARSTPRRLHGCGFDGFQSLYSPASYLIVPIVSEPCDLLKMLRVIACLVEALLNGFAHSRKYSERRVVLR